MKSLTIKVHPLFAAAIVTVIVPAAAIAAGTVLTPPATITGAQASGALFTATNTSTGKAIFASSSAGTAIGARGRGDGVTGQTVNPSNTTKANAAGVSGYDNSTDGGFRDFGIYGQTGSGTGVRGFASNPTRDGATGVEGDANDNGAGVRGFGSIGLFGFGTNPCCLQLGVFGFAIDGAGVFGFSRNQPGVSAETESSTVPSLQVSGGVTSAASPLIIATTFGTGGGDVMSLDRAGNMILKGTLTQNGTPLVVTRTSSGANVTAYQPRQAEPTIEDVGKSRLVNGAGYVRLEPAFAATIDRREQYIVFVTPEGPSRGLYVDNQTASGFSVKENPGGRSTLTFAYRIVAKPFDSSATRLPMALSLPHASKAAELQEKHALDLVRQGEARHNEAAELQRKNGGLLK